MFLFCRANVLNFLLARSSIVLLCLVGKGQKRFQRIGKRGLRQENPACTAIGKPPPGWRGLCVILAGTVAEVLRFLPGGVPAPDLFCERSGGRFGPFRLTRGWQEREARRAFLPSREAGAMLALPWQCPGLLRFCGFWGRVSKTSYPTETRQDMSRQ